MSYNKPIRRIAIVGTGVIGASWAAEYLARGHDVDATDPAPNAEANLRKYVDEAWKDLTNIGLSKGASRDRLTFTKDMKQALANADLVQENGPERPDFKMKLFADMDDATPVDSIIASSSSGITPSVMQSKCKHAERVLVGHPFNPPHIIPLVEVVGGAGGIEHFMTHLMDPLQGMMKALGTPNITPALKQTVVDGVMREAAGRSVDQLAQRENEVLIGLLKLRANGDSVAPAVKSGARTSAMAGATA